jgi:hypothetical protein
VITIVGTDAVVGAEEQAVVIKKLMTKGINTNQCFKVHLACGYCTISIAIDIGVLHQTVTKTYMHH